MVKSMQLTIVRRGYFRSPYKRKDGTKVKGTYVKPAKIKDLGFPGKGKKVIPPLKKGFLGQFGYKSDLSKAQRYAALKRAMERHDPLSISRKLNAVYVLNKNTNPGKALIFHADQQWVSRNYLNH